MKGILFDLDGTLLDIDIDAFLSRYFAALGETIAEMVDADGDHALAMRGIFDATGAMMRPHPGATNREVFNRAYLALTRIDIEAHSDLLARFYDEVFPTLGTGIGPHDGARAAVDRARECGMKVAIATNPIFPLRAIEHRMSWAGIDTTEVDLITSYENMRATKPHSDYYRQICEILDLAPSECLMVGDDRMLDLPAADVGMRTYYVGSDPDVPTDYRGNLNQLANLLARVCGNREG
jgi:FMN phosphatase YigB (HAD superfamily)